MVKLSVKKAEQALTKYALTYPETTLEQPWGHDVVKVKGKMFASFGGEARVKAGSDFEIDTMKGWHDQSYRAVAPKTLVKSLG